MSLQLQTCMSCSAVVQGTRAQTECHSERRRLGLRVNKCPFPTLLGSYCRNISNRSRRRSITVIVNAKEDSSLPASGTEVTFDNSDLVTLEFGRLLGESREKTLSKIVAKKLYPDASYLEIEKIVKKRKDLLGALKISDLEMALHSAKLLSKPINQEERSPQASNDIPKLSSSPVQPEKIVKLSQKPRFQTKGGLDEFKVHAKPLLNVGSISGNGDANIDELVLRKPSITGATSSDTPSPLSGMKAKSRVWKPVKEAGKEDLCLSNSNENMDESMTTFSSQNDANVLNLAQHPIGGHMQDSFGATKSAAVPSLASRPSWGKAVKIQTKEEMSSADPQLTTGATAVKKLAVKEARDVSHHPSLASPPKRHKDSIGLFYEAQPTGSPATVQKGNIQDSTFDDVILRKPVPLQSSDAAATAESDNPEPPLPAEETVLPPSLEDEPSSLSKSKSNLQGEKSLNLLALDPPESNTDSKDKLLEIRTTLNSPSGALNPEDESVGLSSPSSPLQGCEGLGLLYDSPLVAPSSIKNADTGNSGLDSVTLRRPQGTESTVEEDVSVETKLETRSTVSVSSSKEGNIVNTLLRGPISFENDEAYSASFAKEALSLEVKSQPLQCESPGVELLSSSVKQEEREEQNNLAETNNVDDSLQVQIVEKRAPSGINITQTDKDDRRIQGPMRPQNRDSYGHRAKAYAFLQEDEDQEWIQAETLMKSKEHVKVKLSGHSKAGLVASFGYLVGLLPMLELSPKRGLLDYSAWVQQHESDLIQTIRQDTILPNSEHEEFSSTKKAESKKANDLRRKFDEEISQKLSSFVGEKATVVVTSVDKESRQVRFSEIEADPKYREVILKKEELLNELKVGDVVSCEVKNITPIGIFVELQGVSAYIHHSEISWNPGVGATSFLTIGEIIKAQVCRLDKSLKRINLSLKSLQQDPLKLTLESVVGDTEGESVIQESEAAQEPEWAELESLIRNLQQLDSIESVSNGRRLCGTALAPTFQVLLSAPQTGGYKLLVRSGKQIQEVLVRTTLDWESMKKCIQMCTFADSEEGN